MGGATVKAKWVAAGVGEPMVWLGTDDRWRKDGDTHEMGAWARLGMRLDDHQTRAGLLRRLAMWAGLA